MKLARTCTRSAVIALVLLVLSFLTGCQSSDERLERSVDKGDRAMRGGHPDTAVDAYILAMGLVARYGGHCDDHKVEEARDACAVEARSALTRAHENMGTNASLARDFVNQAIRLSGSSYGANVKTETEARGYLTEVITPYFAREQRHKKSQQILTALLDVTQSVERWSTASSSAPGFADSSVVLASLDRLRRELDDSQYVDPEQRRAMSPALIDLRGAIELTDIWRTAPTLSFERKASMTNDISRALNDLIRGLGQTSSSPVLPVATSPAAATPATPPPVAAAGTAAVPQSISTAASETGTRTGGSGLGGRPGTSEGGNDGLWDGLNRQD